MKMSKPIITQEQAGAIEKLKAEHFHSLETLFKNPENYCLKDFEKPLLKLTPEKYHDALYIGYEVEPEFKAGQWIYDITDKNKTVIEVAYVTDRRVHGFWKTQHSDIDTNVAIENARHFTKAEIAKARERSWWAKNDRDVWEIREDDILEYLNDLYIVDSFDSERVYLKSGIERKSDYAEPFDFVKKHFKVVAFSEDRKDV